MQSLTESDSSIGWEVAEGYSGVAIERCSREYQALKEQPEAVRSCFTRPIEEVAGLGSKLVLDTTAAAC